MILNGNQRGGALNLANHLLSDENDHVMVHEVSGFACEDIHGAFKEAYALSKGTKCQQYLFSLSLNPPADKDVSNEQFEQAIAQVEDKLGLKGQPRVIVFHEKKGKDHEDDYGPERRHCHVVWSRIDLQNMKAIQLSHSKRKLMDVSRDLYQQMGWEKDMPIGLTDRTKRDPRNFTLDEWQQAQRQGKDPRDSKCAIQDAWAISDNKHSFEAALSERGFLLARGKRPFVVIDMDGDVYALPRVLKLKTKDIRAKLGEERQLPSLEMAQAKIRRHMQTALGRLQRDVKERQQALQAEARRERMRMVKAQRKARGQFLQSLQLRQQQEASRRASRFRKGLPGLWDIVRGENRRIRKENELHAKRCQERDAKALNAFVKDQLNERRALSQTYQKDRQTLQATERSLMAQRQSSFDRGR